MALQELHTDAMTSGVVGIITSSRVTIDHAKTKITVIDNNKIPFDEAIRNLDRDIHNQIELVNDTLENVEKEYQNRIDVQGCRSDLFWRVIGITTGMDDDGAGNDVLSVTVDLICQKLSPAYTVIDNATPPNEESSDELGYGDGNTGFTTNAVMWYTGTGSGSLPGITTITMDVRGDKLMSAGSGFDTYLEPDNLHALKLYVEPYSKDVFDLSVATGIGTIGVGSTQLIMLTTNVDIGVKIGDLVQSSDVTTFAGNSGNVVVGVSSTTMDLSPYTDILGIGTQPFYNVPLITLSTPSISSVTAPNDDGKYTFFDFSKDPNLISDAMAVSPTANPYVPQVITIMGTDDYSGGVKTEYDNSGISSARQEWNKFMDGLPDPDQIPEIVPIEEPKVGGDKIYYPVGFDQKPIGIGGGDAAEGDTLSLSSDEFGTALYAALPNCDDSAVNNAINVRNAAEAALAADGDFVSKIELSNKIRLKRNEFNLAIWAYRAHIGESDDRIISSSDFVEIIKTSPYKDLMNFGTE